MLCLQQFTNVFELFVINSIQDMGLNISNFQNFAYLTQATYSEAQRDSSNRYTPLMSITYVRNNIGINVAKWAVL